MPIENCTAAVLHRGEHVPCDNGRDHAGWPHSNAPHEMVWRGEGDERRWTPDWKSTEATS